MIPPIIDDCIEQAHARVSQFKVLQKILHDDYGMVYGKHYTDAHIAVKDGKFQIVFTPIKPIEYLEFKIEVERE